jgi:hypothetical protein
MSKPFELTIYPPRIPCSLWPQCPIEFHEVDNWGPDKTLTDAELAAELFRQTAWLGAIGRAYATETGRNIVIEAAFTFGPVTRDEDEWLTIKRFATLPHYDEEQS